MNKLGMVVFAGLVLVAGCATTSTEGGAEAEEPVAARPVKKKVDKNVEKIRQQAAFDLQCEGAELDIKLVRDDGMMGKTYGARGCARQATYKLVCGGMGIGGCTVFNEAQAARYSK
jgi:hypothetical protein